MREGECWKFRVSDNGIGIDAEYAERIFVIFQRLHPRSQYEGTGIGLAMCRKIVEYHGGRMWLDTEHAGGRGFYLLLHLACRTGHGASMTEDDSQPISVLLVEDDPGDVVLIEEAFEHNKVRNSLKIVGDGVEAMEFLRDPANSRPDLVLLDLNLPRKDGREVLAEIKTDPELRSIPVVVLTTSKAEEDILRSYDLHANAYVTKPVDFNRFIEVVRQIDEFFVTVVKLPGHRPRRAEALARPARGGRAGGLWVLFGPAAGPATATPTAHRVGDAVRRPPTRPRRPRRGGRVADGARRAVGDRVPPGRRRAGRRARDRADPAHPVRRRLAAARDDGARRGGTPERAGCSASRSRRDYSGSARVRVLHGARATTGSCASGSASGCGRC